MSPPDADLAAATPSPAAEMFEIDMWCDLVAAAPPALAAATGLQMHRIGGVVAVAAPGIPSPEFNRAVGLGVGHPATGDEIAGTLDLFRSRGCKGAWVQVMTGAGPADLATQLAGQGAAAPASRWVVVERAATPLPVPPTGLTLSDVGPQQAEEAGEVFCRAYGLPPPFGPWTAALVGRPGWTIHAASAGGRIVAVAHVVVRGDRAMLIGAATLPEARGRGAQSALIARRIAAAQALGAMMVQTHTWVPDTPGGNPSLNNMLRAGFRPLHLRQNWQAGG
jgi:GNAT superfamily N-acetyltransferase